MVAIRRLRVVQPADVACAGAGFVIGAVRVVVGQRRL